MFKAAKISLRNKSDLPGPPVEFPFNQVLKTDRNYIGQPPCTVTTLTLFFFLNSYGLGLGLWLEYRLGKADDMTSHDFHNSAPCFTFGSNAV